MIYNESQIIYVSLFPTLFIKFIQKFYKNSTKNLQETYELTQFLFIKSRIIRCKQK